MDIKELDKKQLILLVLLITFVVSIGTGIVTVSLMKQMPKSVPQTINNVIQRTIERVSTIQVPTPDTNNKVDSRVVDSKSNSTLLLGGSDALVNIYLNKTNAITPVANTTDTLTSTTNITEVVNINEPVAIGQGIIISEVGLILVDSSILIDQGSYKVILNKIDFSASVLKSFSNGFTVMKISSIITKDTGNTDTTSKTQ